VWRTVAGVFLIMGAALYLWKGRNIRAELTMTGSAFDGLHEDVKRMTSEVLRAAWAAGLPVGIYEGLRTRDDQQAAIDSGASKVSDPDSSYHRWGLAVDFVFLNRLGGWTWEPENGMDDWQRLGQIIKRAGFQWGGDFKTFFDGPHAQYPLMSIGQLKAAYGSPESVTWA
jgi:hypothetical protein